MKLPKLYFMKKQCPKISFDEFTEKVELLLGDEYKIKVEGGRTYVVRNNQQSDEYREFLKLKNTYIKAANNYLHDTHKGAMLDGVEFYKNSIKILYCYDLLDYDAVIIPLESLFKYIENN